MGDRERERDRETTSQQAQRICQTKVYCEILQAINEILYQEHFFLWLSNEKRYALIL